MLLVPCIGVLVLGILVTAFSGKRTSRFEVSPEGLRLRGDFYGWFIAARHLKIDAARRVDFATEPALTPRIRTMGTGLPGYSAGWFRLRNGEKALVYLTDRRHTVYVPTDDGYSVLVSPADPDGFLAAVRTLK